MSNSLCVLCDNEGTIGTKVGPMCDACVKPLDFFSGVWKEMNRGN